MAGVMVSIVAFQAVDPGSIPGSGELFLSAARKKKKKKKKKKKGGVAREFNPGFLLGEKKF